ncbi:MAG: tol-pal system protein YbgF [Thermodesulfovibrionales bacterium]
MKKVFKIDNSRSNALANFLRFTAFSLLSTILCLLFACATSSDLDMMRYDLNKVQRDSVSLRNDVNTLKEKTTGVAKEESFDVMRQNQAEMQSSLSVVSRDIQVLSGRFDENKYFIEKTLKDSTAETDLLKAQITSIESRIKELKDRLNNMEKEINLQKEPLTGQSKEPEKKEEAAKETKHSETQPVKSAKPSDKTKYETADAAYKNKKYKEARENFEAFLKESPKHERAEDAYFLIAESYYNEKDFEGSILAYETVLKKYPNSKKAPAALFKQGLSFIEIGDKKTGKVILEQLIERYPKSKEVELARKNLENLDKKPAKKKK